jgi:hypothetical protein
MRTMMAAGLAGLLSMTATAAQADEKPSGPPPTVWTVLSASGKADGSETLRVVRHEDGKVFASGETKGGGKARKAVKTFVQRKGDGALAKYERRDGGVNGPGVRVFEFEGQMRYATVNGAGRPVELGGAITGALWDSAAWHLVDLWPWPDECKPSTSLTIWSVDRKAAGKVELACEGGRKVRDAAGETVSVNAWKVTGGVTLTVLVARGGRVVAADGEGRSLLLARWSLDGAAPAADAPAGGDAETEGTEALKERGTGP